MASGSGGTSADSLGSHSGNTDDPPNNPPPMSFESLDRTSHVDPSDPELSNERSPARLPSPDHSAANTTPRNNSDGDTDTDTNDEPEPEPELRLEDLKIAQMFVDLLRQASLDDKHSGLDSETLARLRNPLQEELRLDDPDICFSITTYLNASQASQECYNQFRSGVLKRYPDSQMLSYYDVKKQVAELSGVLPIKTDMCPQSCIAFAGAFVDHQTCPHCNHPRYDPKKTKRDGTKVAYKQYSTFPIGPQLQALWRTPNGADALQYRRMRTQEIFEQLGISGSLDKFNNLLSGEDYLNAVHQDDIRDDDMVLMLSADGAQLYKSKISDFWIYIWILVDHSPGSRYKKRYVVPGSGYRR